MNRPPRGLPEGRASERRLRRLVIIVEGFDPQTLPEPLSTTPGRERRRTTDERVAEGVGLLGGERIQLHGKARAPARAPVKLTAPHLAEQGQALRSEATHPHLDEDVAAFVRQALTLDEESTEPEVEDPMGRRLPPGLGDHVATKIDRVSRRTTPLDPNLDTMKHDDTLSPTSSDIDRREGQKHAAHRLPRVTRTHSTKAR